MDRVRDYISHTTYNTNPAILDQIMKEESNNVITIKVQELVKTTSGDLLLPDNLKNGKLKELFLRGKRIIILDEDLIEKIKYRCNSVDSEFSVGEYTITDNELLKPAPRTQVKVQPLVGSYDSALKPEYLLKNLNKNDLVITDINSHTHSVKPGTFKKTLEAFRNGEKVYAFRLKDGETEEYYYGLSQLNMPYYTDGTIKIKINYSEEYVINESDEVFIKVR